MHIEYTHKTRERSVKWLPGSGSGVAQADGLLHLHSQRPILERMEVIPPDRRSWRAFPIRPRNLLTYDNIHAT